MAKTEKTPAELIAEGLPPSPPVPPVWTIKTPNASFRGDRFGVRIFDGVGTTTNAKAAAACRQIGYEVEGPPTGKAPTMKAT